MIKNDIIVLIPHYNDTKGLITSIRSIDSSEEIDVLVVDDGSVIDNINENLIKENFTAKGNVIFIYLTKNKGIEYALNLGLKYILKENYKFVARLDTGDKCLDKRFKIQKEFLNNNKDIKLVGSHVRVNDINGSFLYNLIVPIKSDNIKKKIFLTSTLIHPSIMFCLDIIEKVGFYPTIYKAAEDYAYYYKILKYYNCSNINLILVEKELNPNSISVKKRKIQALNKVRIIVKNFYFGYYPIVGLLRNFILYLIPNNILIRIKTYKQNVNKKTSTKKYF